MKILLLTDVPPCKEFSGALLTEQLCKFVPEDSIVCFVILNPYLKNINFKTDLDKLRIKYTSKPLESSGCFFPLFLGSLFSFFIETFVNFFKRKKILKQIYKFAKENEIDRLWVILQGQTMIQIARPTARKLKVPLLIQIWDHPIWWLKENKVNKISSYFILKEFENVIKESSFCATASFAMSENFTKEYQNIKTIPLIASLSSQLIKKSLKFFNDKKEITIGMAGQLYSKQEWESLLSALDSIEWKFNEKEIKIIYLGYHLSIGGHKKAHVEYLGYRSQEETISILSNTDILYCPYFFDPYYEVIAKTSFPSKLTTYLAAGKPVFFHGPDYASPAIFLKKENAGIICSSLQTEEILKKIENLISDKNLYENLAKNGTLTISNYLVLEKLKDNFFNFLGLKN